MAALEQALAKLRQIDERDFASYEDNSALHGREAQAVLVEIARLQRLADQNMKSLRVHQKNAQIFADRANDAEMEVERLQHQLEEAQKALAYYAEPRNHTTRSGGEPMLWWNDNYDYNGPGARARAALAGSVPATGEGAATCNCEACAAGVVHASDCSVHNMPAFPNGECDCGASLRFGVIDRRTGKKVFDCGSHSLAMRHVHESRFCGYLEVVTLDSSGDPMVAVPATDTDSEASKWDVKCDGSKECGAVIHEHGCFSDDGHCTLPWEHAAAGSTAEDTEGSRA